MLNWKEKKALPRAWFNDRITDAFCVGRGGNFRDDWDKWPDSRVCEEGYAIAFRPREYVLVSWQGVSLRELTLYYFRDDTDIPEIVAPAIADAHHQIEDAVLAHGNPERLAYVRAQRAEWARRQQMALKRDGLDSLAATLPAKTFFSTPSGRVGQVVGVGAKIATWRYLDELPPGAEAVALDGEPWSRAG